MEPYILKNENKIAKTNWTCSLQGYSNINWC